MTDYILAVILAGLAGWRLAVFVTIEDGPFDLMERFRAQLGIPAAGPQDPFPFLGEMLQCPGCTSVWTTIGAYIVGETVGWQPVAIVAACGLALAVMRAWPLWEKRR